MAQVMKYPSLFAAFARAAAAVVLAAFAVGVPLTALASPGCQAINGITGQVSAADSAKEGLHKSALDVLDGLTR